MAAALARRSFRAAKARRPRPDFKPHQRPAETLIHLQTPFLNLRSSAKTRPSLSPVPSASRDVIGRQGAVVATAPPFSLGKPAAVLLRSSAWFP